MSYRRQAVLVLVAVTDAKNLLAGGLPPLALHPQVLAHQGGHHDLLAADGVQLVVEQADQPLVGTHHEGHQTEEALVEGLDEVLLAKELRSSMRRD